MTDALPAEGEAPAGVADSLPPDAGAENDPEDAPRPPAPDDEKAGPTTGGILHPEPEDVSSMAAYLGIDLQRGEYNLLAVAREAVTAPVSL